MFKKQYFIIMLFLPVMASVFVVSCQSPISRSPNAISTKTTYNEMRTLTHELVLSISDVSKPHLMLFEQFQSQIPSVGQENFQPDQFVYLGRTFHLFKNLSASLESDPFIEPLSKNSLRLLNQIDNAFLQSKNIDLIAQKAMDLQIQRQFMLESKTRFMTLLNQHDVQISPSEKKKIYSLMNRLENSLYRYHDRNEIEMRSLASMPPKATWSKKELQYLEKISARSIQVSDQGDIFGGNEANLKAIQIQYGLQFILKVLSLHEKQNSWKAIR